MSSMQVLKPVPSLDFIMRMNFVTVQTSGGVQGYFCAGCNEGNMCPEQLKLHTQKKKHKDALKRYKNRTNKQLRRFSKIIGAPLGHEVRRAARIQDEKHKHAIQAGMLCYLTAPASNNDNMDDDAAFDTLLQPALKKLKTCESNERLAVLALAVWKAQCIVDMPKDDSKEGYLAAMEWVRKGWKSRKEEQRNANAIDTVVLAVKPFLLGA